LVPATPAWDKYIGSRGEIYIDIVDDLLGKFGVDSLRPHHSFPHANDDTRDLGFTGGIVSPEEIFMSEKYLLVV
jgi:hypothetical protein